MTMRPLVESITIALALSRLAGSGWASAGAAQTSAAMRARTRIMKTPQADERVTRLKSLQPNLAFKALATAGGTKAETSPPMPAIWRTRVAVIGRTAGDAGT